MRCIVLTAQEAAAVRGETSKGAALDPVLLNDGTYALPERVISDSRHATKFGALGSKSRRDVAETEFASYTAPEPEPERIRQLDLDDAETAMLKAMLEKDPDGAAILAKLQALDDGSEIGLGLVQPRKP